MMYKGESAETVTGTLVVHWKSCKEMFSGSKDVQISIQKLNKSAAKLHCNNLQQIFVCT